MGVGLGVAVLNTMARADLAEKGCLNIDFRECAGQLTGEECSEWKGQTVQRPWGELCLDAPGAERPVQSERWGGDGGQMGSPFKASGGLWLLL